MRRTGPNFLATLFGFVLLTGCWSGARAAGKAGESAPDFPPGVFNDGGRYRLSDFEGKVLVLFFYEQDCPTCRGSIKDRNKIVEQYKGKPVKFIAVAAGDSLQEAKAYAGQTKLAMPVFADSLSLMEKRYGESISLQNIWQFRIVGPGGKVVGYRMEAEDIDRALAQVELRFDPKDYHEKLAKAVELFEWNQYAAGMKALRPHLKSPKADIAESAKELTEAVKAEGEKWVEEADAAAEEDPVKAYDLYARAAECFKTDDLGKKADAAAKKLKSKEPVKRELDARKMFDRIANVMGQATPSHKAEIAKAAENIVKKYPGTPTAERAEELKQELGA